MRGEGGNLWDSYVGHNYTYLVVLVHGQSLRRRKELVVVVVVVVVVIHERQSF